MDPVRQSINSEENLAVVQGEGDQTFVDDSFYKFDPPQAVSTVGRTKSRRFNLDTDGSSFLEDRQDRGTRAYNPPPASINGARPKIPSGAGPNLGSQHSDWSVVNAWCRENKSDNEMSSNGDTSSMGILNLDEMDLSTNNLLLETPMDEMRGQNTEKESPYVDFGKEKKVTVKSTPSSVERVTPTVELRSTLSNSSENSTQERPFARSQVKTVKKFADIPKNINPITAAIRHSLFGKMTIGEEGDDKDTSIYEVQIQAEEINEIDNDFELSDSEEEECKMPVNKSLPKMTVFNDEIKIDSIYLKPGRHIEQTTASSLPCLSKVSLFDGSEIDTDDELEQARKEQGSRQEAPGRDSMRHASRPGLEGGCSDDQSGDRLPITQRQSAEGDVVSSPVPGDGGGGGDGSSGTESDDGRRSRVSDSGRVSAGYASNLRSDRYSTEYEEQRIRPMGDDLLSEMRGTRYEHSTNQDREDSARISSRYLAPSAHVDDTNNESVKLDDIFGSRTGDEDNFSPGNRLEASGYNADDAKQTSGSHSNLFGQFESSFGSFGLGPGGSGRHSGSNPNLFGQFESSFGSFGLDPGGSGQFPGEGQSMVGLTENSGNRQKSEFAAGGNRSSGEQSWTQLVGSAGTSFSSRQNSFGSEPRTSNDFDTGNTNFEQTDYARLNNKERGKPLSTNTSRELQGGQPLSTSSVRNFSTVGKKTDLKDSAIFKKPFLPPAKDTVVFTKSVAKQKTNQSGSYKSTASGKSDSKNRDSRKSDSMDFSDMKNDLAYRLSLSYDAEKQKVGLQRVLSCGETSIKDMTVGDDSFFGEADGLAMLDEAEKQFEHDNVFRQDDNMESEGTSNDSWVYKSTTVRPSWLRGSSNDGGVLVNISSYMRGRTEALGALSGDEDALRPTFGMTITSPDKDHVQPAPLIDDSDIRTSGVGEQNSGLQADIVGLQKLDKDDHDYTMSIESLLKTPKVVRAKTDTETRNDVSRLSDGKKDGQNDISIQPDMDTSRKSDEGEADDTLAELSRWVKESVDYETLTKRFAASRARKEKLKSEAAQDVKSMSSVTPSISAETVTQSKRNDMANGQLSDGNSRQEAQPPDGNEGSASQQPVAAARISPKSDHQNCSVMSDVQKGLTDQRSIRAIDVQSITKSNDPRTVDRVASLSPRSDISCVRKSEISRICAGGSDLGYRPERSDITRVNTSEIDHGYMLGHHIPDGTAYSERSDFTHMNHKGMLREDVAGADNVGLAESRGFDMLNRRNNSQALSRNLPESNRDKLRNTKDIRIQESAPTETGANENSALRELTQAGTRENSAIRELSKTGANENSAMRELTQTGSREKTATRDISETGSRENIKRDVAQTVNDKKRHESWTQTSLIFESCPGIQSNNAPVSNKRDSQPRAQSNSDSGIQTDSFNLTDNMKSRQTTQRNEPERQHLLTRNTSLLTTQFAQENLRRDYNNTIMDRIYSNTAETDSRPDKRFSIMSTADWTMLRDQETMDTTMFSQFDRSQVGPMPSQWKSIQMKPDNTALPEDMTNFNFATPGRLSLCHVEAPGVLKFQRVCCIGISVKETLPLKNNSDGWIECRFQVQTILIEGRPTSLDFSPFEYRHEKIIIGPYKTESIDILFLPKVPGAYVAQVQIFSRAVSRNSDEKCTDMRSIPVNVAFQAIAELPLIKVRCSDGSSDVLDFGETVWGLSIEKTLLIENLGQATVPVRLAITSTRGWHCFSFEPEGEITDVSTISGRSMPQATHHKTIINISLSGCHEGANRRSVVVWCRPPEKANSRMMARQPAEQVSCNLDVEVDIPCCTFQKLASVPLKALIGVRKLHIPTNLKRIKLETALQTSTETSVKLFNAGNLTLTVTLGFSNHGDVFTVNPDRLDISPGDEREVIVMFKPLDRNTLRYKGLLLLNMIPDGQLFEVELDGEVKKKSLNLMCDCTSLDFGGVGVGQTVIKRYRVRNEESYPLSLLAETRINDVFLSLAPSGRGEKRLNLLIPGKDMLSVYVEFTPSTQINLAGKIRMKPEDDPSIFVVKVKGYSGVSKLCCAEDTIIEGLPCVTLNDPSQLTEVVIRNIGVQTACVKVTLYKDLNCTMPFTGSHMIIQPSEFTIEPQEQKVLQLVTSLSIGEFMDHCDSNGIGAVLRLWYKDDVQSPKPHISELRVGVKKRSVEPVTSITPPLASSLSQRTPNFHTQGWETHNFHRQPSEMNNFNNQPLRDTTSYRMSDNINNLHSEGTDYGSWTIYPEEMVLYHSRRAAENQMGMLCITNNKNSDLSFEISWPGSALCVTPCRGNVKPREVAQIKILTSTNPRLVDQLPMCVTVSVTANNQVKNLKVRICRGLSGEEDVPVPDQTRLGATSIPQSGASLHKLGNLEISKTNVNFPCTRVGTISEQFISLKNVGPDMLRWIFSSFATPYLQKTADRTKEMFRLSYKVFDISHQFGKINGLDNKELKLSFMPRSSGTFTQYWDLQITGNSSRSNTIPGQDYIRICFTGEGFEEVDPQPKPANSITREILDSIPLDKKLSLVDNKFIFPPAKPGDCVILKAELKNEYNEDIRVEVTSPRAPFYVQHQCFMIKRKRYLRFPVQFKPTRVGKYNDTLQFTTVKGDSLMLYLKGECC